MAFLGYYSELINCNLWCINQIDRKHLLKSSIENSRDSMIDAKRLKAFLCHSSHDKESVRELYKKLYEDGLDPWLDEKNILPGQVWKAEIRKAIRNSHAVIVCVSTNSINKVGYVQKEIKFALDVADEQPEGIVFLIPVRLDDCDMPERLSHLQYADLHRDEYEKVLQTLQIRASKLGIRIQKRIKDSIRSLVKEQNTDEENRLRFLNEKFNSAFEKLQQEPKSHPPKSSNRFNLTLVGTERVGKTAIIYALTDERELNFLSTRAIINTEKYHAVALDEDFYVNEVNILAKNSLDISSALQYTDFAIYVLSPDHPLTSFDRRVIEAIRLENIPLIVLVNKIDTLRSFYFNDFSSTIEEETKSITVCYSVLDHRNIGLLRDFLFRTKKFFQ